MNTASTGGIKLLCNKQFKQFKQFVLVTLELTRSFNIQCILCNILYIL